MATIKPDTVTERIQHGEENLLLLDIRHPDQFEDWHIPGSINIDVYDTLKEHPEQAAAAFQDLPADKEIVTVCGVGAVSATATDVLRDLGYDAKTLDDGLRGWSRVHLTAPIPINIPGELIQVTRPGTGCLSYILISGNEAAIIDPSQYTDKYEELLDERNASLTAVLETHAHADHISGAQSLANDHAVPYYLHPDDAGDLTTTTPIHHGEELLIADASIGVVHTPGHTQGSVTFAIEDKSILTGDTLFLNSVGRPDLDGGTTDDIRRRARALYESLQHLLDQPGDILVTPAHDSGTPYPPTTATLNSVRDRYDLLQSTKADFADALTDRVPETPPNHEQIKRVNVGKETIEAADAEGIELGPNRCAAE